MGIFSFLSGKGGEGAASEQAPDGARDAGATVTEAAPAQAGSGVDAETPFVAPSAWDMDTAALTAPAPSTAGNQPQVGPPDPAKTAALQAPIIEVIKTVYDPEIPVDIYELGLIYDIIVDADNKALVRMTLTSPACPSAQQLPSEVRYKVKAVDGISDAAVEVVWEPPWDKDRMSEAARLSLGFF
jgi:FeS assembly SUF system protein